MSILDVELVNSDLNSSVAMVTVECVGPAVSSWNHRVVLRHLCYAELCISSAAPASLQPVAVAYGDTDFAQE